LDAEEALEDLGALPVVHLVNAGELETLSGGAA
jgi:hypothetical protein